MSVLLCVSFILQVGYCQVQVHEVVYTWLDSHATLDCRANTQEEIKQITWEVKVDGNSRTFLTYRNDTGPIFQTPYKQRVRLTGDGYKDGSIEILNVTLADEGIFKCVFTTYPSGTIEGETKLQVLILPSVRQELKPDVRTPCINMVAECLASSAKPAAEIQWITHGINYTSKENITTNPNGTTSKWSQLYMISTPELYGQEVFCLVYQPKIPSEYQKNLTINYTLTNIEFPPQIVQIEVLKSDEEALQLLCKSDGNPKPKYNWKRENTEKSEDIRPDLYQVTSATLNFMDTYGDGLYICEAANSVGVNRGYIYMYPANSFSRHRLWLILSIFAVISVTLCAVYLTISRLLQREEYGTFISKRESIQDKIEEKLERNETAEEETRVITFNLTDTEQEQSGEASNIPKKELGNTVEIHLEEPKWDETAEEETHVITFNLTDTEQEQSGEASNISKEKL